MKPNSRLTAPLSDANLEQEYKDCMEIIDEWNTTSRDRVLQKKSLSESQILAFLKLSYSTITHLHTALLAARVEIERLEKLNTNIHIGIHDSIKILRGLL